MSLFTAGILIIGDEILSGRTQDTNANFIARNLTSSGIKLEEIRVIQDSKKIIIDSVKLFSEKYNYVFTTGGIGPTHDDITSESIAKAFKVDLEVNPQALAILKEYYKDSELTEARLKMTKIPNGAELVENPVSKAPGFKIENVFVMAGIPKIMQGMLEGAKIHLSVGEPMKSESVDVFMPESFIAEELSNLQNKFKDVEIGSYPFVKDGKYGTSLVMRSSDKAKLSDCRSQMELMISKLV